MTTLSPEIVKLALSESPAPATNAYVKLSESVSVEESIPTSVETALPSSIVNADIAIPDGAACEKIDTVKIESAKKKFIFMILFF